jgi:hypothetical protein
VTENAPSWTEKPVVTGLMVFDRPQQVVAARSAIQCFLDQNWPFKELVIFNATQHALVPWWKRLNVREIRLKPRKTNEMLALCAENANGEWLVNWLPDCWYHPDYLLSHMHHRDKQRIVVFRHKQAYALKDKKTVIVSNDSVLCWSFYRHFPVDFVNKPLIEQFTHVALVDNPANLIVKFASEIV